eukprot:c24821_g2_i2 orf=246-2837(+)
MRCLLLYTKDMKSAMAEIVCRGGYVTHRLSRFVLVAMLPLSLKPSLLKKSSTKSPSKRSLDPFSRRMVHAWLAVKLKTDSTVYRPIPLVLTGSVAVAVLIVSGQSSDLQFSDSEIDDGILPALLEGSNALVSSETSADLSFTFEPYPITISPSEKLSSGGGITAWPCAVSFNDKLYCFHGGNGSNRKKLVCCVFDGSSWEADVVSSTTITEGPSAVVFNEKLYCFHQGNDSDSRKRWLWYNVFDGSSWEGDQEVPNTRITGGPSAVVYNDKLYCFHQGYTGNDNEFWYNVFDGSTWAGDLLVDDTQLTASPSAVVFQDLIYCFYQGVGDYANTLLMNVFDPATGVWSGHSTVPLTTCMSEGPSAVIFDERIYVFYQSASSTGQLYFNSTSDGVLWKGFTPVADIRTIAGPGTVVFDSELYSFYQSADDEGFVYYRSFVSGGLNWERLWADPALQQLGYSSNYGGFEELADAVRTSKSTDNGYVVCITKFSLAYSAYANETRLCIKNPNDNISTTFAQIFGSSGKYDISVSSDDTSTEPRYTFAQSSAIIDELPIALYSTCFVFHQGADSNSGTQLWFSLLDRRTSWWVEMQGPTTSTTYTGVSALLYDSKTYVFYSSDSDGSLFYNVLDGTSWEKEQVVPSTYSSATPSVIIFDSKLYCFHQGADNNGQLWYNAFDLENSTWEGDIQVADVEIVQGPSAVVFNGAVYCFYQHTVPSSANHLLRYSVFNGSSWGTSTVVNNTYMTGEPSAVVYDDKIYCFHQGGKTDGTVWYNVFDGSEWAGDEKMELDMKISDGPSAMVLDGKILVFFRAKSDKTQLWYNVLDGSNGWIGESILTTGSGTSTQPGAFAIGMSASIAWDSCPAE